MISIIIPVWNSASFLDDCLATIAAQTVSDWECLLVDDGSEDDSYRVCCRWSERDGRFKPFRQNHLGVSAARNRGIKEAVGSYLVFIDSDDTVAPTYLESLLQAAPAELVVGGYVRCYPDENKENTFWVPSSRLSFKISPQNAAIFAELNDKFLLYGPCSKLYDAGIIKHYSVSFPENRSLGEDLEFNYLYLRHIDSISCIPVCDYYYMKRKAVSLSSERRQEHFYSDLEQWRIIKAFCEERGLLGKEMEDLLARRLWEIVYDSLLPKGASKEEPEWAYYKSILKIPELRYLNNHKDAYPCSDWLKTLILRRSALFFFLKNRLSRKRMDH